MKYNFDTHIGFENFQNRLKLYYRMVDVLHQTGSKVNFHIRSKSWRKDNWHFPAPIGMICYENGVANWYEMHGWNRIERGVVMPSKFSKQMMVQIIKKALKNKMREKK